MTGLLEVQYSYVANATAYCLAHVNSVDVVYRRLYRAPEMIRQLKITFPRRFMLFRDHNRVRVMEECRRLYNFRTLGFASSDANILKTSERFERDVRFPPSPYPHSDD